MKSGYTTGACAAAAARAAAMTMAGARATGSTELVFPDGKAHQLPIAWQKGNADRASAAVIKDAGDDPDVTDGAEIICTLQAGAGRSFIAGPGVGTITRPGLQLPPGEAAINPVPRKMITEAIAGIAPEDCSITVAVSGGALLAEKTWNPRLGINGGISILGTTGIVRPYCRKAAQQAIRTEVAVACANGGHPLCCPGNIGAKAARSLGHAEHEIIEVGNEWGLTADAIAHEQPDHVRLMGHPGKLAKLIIGDWYTHSHHSAPAAPLVAEHCRRLLGYSPDSETVEGIFAQLKQPSQRQLGDALAKDIAMAFAERSQTPCSVRLVAMDGHVLGAHP